MDDIVEELRAAHRQWTSGSPGCSDCGTHEKCLGQRAADVIEKLRASLTPIGTIPKNGGIGFIPFSTAVAAAVAMDISRACDIADGFAFRSIASKEESDGEDRRVD